MRGRAPPGTRPQTCRPAAPAAACTPHPRPAAEGGQAGRHAGQVCTAKMKAPSRSPKQPRHHPTRRHACTITTQPPAPTPTLNIHMARRHAYIHTPGSSRPSNPTQPQHTLIPTHNPTHLGMHPEVFSLLRGALAPSVVLLHPLNQPAQQVAGGGHLGRGSRGAGQAAQLPERGSQVPAWPGAEQAGEQLVLCPNLRERTATQHP